MKNQLIVTLTLGLGMMISRAHSQTASPDFQEINRKADEEEFADEVKFSQVLKKLGRMTNAKEVLDSEFKTEKDLSGSDLEFKPLLRCASQFARQKRGGSEGVKVLASILENIVIGGRLIEDSFEIQKATDECALARKSLLSSRVSREKLESTAYKVKTNANVQRFLGHLYSRDLVLCEDRDLTVGAYAGIGAAAGGTHARCLFSNGEVTNYVGISVGFTGGVGGMVSMSKYKSVPSRNTTANRAFYVAGISGHDNIALGPFSHLGENKVLWLSSQGWGKSYETVNLGLGHEGIFSKARLAVRIFPGKTRWAYLLKLLR